MITEETTKETSYHVFIRIYSLGATYLPGSEDIDGNTSLDFYKDQDLRKTAKGSLPRNLRLRYAEAAKISSFIGSLTRLPSSFACKLT